MGSILHGSPLRVLHLILGGTIEADPAQTRPVVDPVTGKTTTMVVRNNRILTRELMNSLPGVRVVSKLIANIDSKKLTMKHVHEALRQIEQADAQGYDRVVITVGTDRGVEFMRSLEREWYKRHKERPPLDIVGTASFVELADTQRKPDGPDNIRLAVSHPVPHGQHGFYWAFKNDDGQVIFTDPTHVKKDFDKKRFVETKRPQFC